MSQFYYIYTHMALYIYICGQPLILEEGSMIYWAELAFEHAFSQSFLVRFPISIETRGSVRGVTPPSSLLGFVTENARLGKGHPPGAH